MRRTLILDLALARRLELAEARAAVDSAEALERRRAASGAAVEAIAGGYAVYCGANSPLTQAVGLGLAGPMSEQEFRRLEEFYRTRSESVRVETCPLADPSLIEQFGKSAYRLTEFTNVMARPMELAQSERWPDPPAGVSIDKVAPSEMPQWALTVAQGFAESHAITDELLEVMELFGSGPNAECYLAQVDGQSAGGAALAIRDGIAGLFGASTLPEFRGRGVQTALLHARMGRAAETGAELAMCLAQPGSISERNVVRQGFQVLYTRVKFERSWS
jgi:GNAT superfamily N-acetyltransferase